MLRAVTYLTLLIGFVFAGLGVYALLAPAEFAAILAEVYRRSNLYFLGAARILIGVIILLASSNSRMPFVLGTLAVLIILAGVLHPFMQIPLRLSVQQWVAGANRVPLQAWAAMALLAGSFIVYATLPRRKS